MLITILTFLLPPRKLTENLSISAIALFLIVLLSLLTDHFLRFSAFSLGAILITFMILNERDDFHAFKSITTDFFVQRASDIMAFVGRCVIDKFLATPHAYPASAFVETPISMVAGNLYFFAIALKIISSICLLNHFLVRPDDVYSNLIPRKIYSTVAPQILFLQFSRDFQSNLFEESIFLVVAIIVFLFTVVLIVMQRDRNRFYEYIINLFSCAAFLVTCIGNYVAAMAIICCILLFGPLLYLGQAHRLTGVMTEEAHQSSPLAPALVIQLFLRIPSRALYLLAKVFLTFFSDIYAGILLYRVPRFFLGLLQIPLRLLHNGNIQRSLIFVVIMLFSYFLWWGYR